jgi:large subunit ribosomal protein L10
MIKEYPVVGLVNLYKIPSAAFQRIKQDLGDHAKIKVSKKSLICRALEKCGIKELAEHAEGQVALVLTKMNPFKLLFFLQKKTSTAPAKPGDVAQEDIVVPAGPTDIPPGPAISTLTKVKIPAKIEGGKIVIQRDTVVCKKGEVVSEDLAAALNLLKMEPMKIGLKLIAVWENGKVYTGDVLDITEEEIIENLNKAYSTALQLSIGMAYPTKENIELLLQKAYINAKALAQEVEEVK